MTYAAFPGALDFEPLAPEMTVLWLVMAHGPRDMPVWGEVWSKGGSKQQLNELARLLAIFSRYKKTAQTASTR